MTPLHAAVSEGEAKIVKLLLQFGANVNATDKKRKFTPLHLAVDQEQKDMVQLLLGVYGSFRLKSN